MFWIGSCVCTWTGLNCDHPIYTSHVAGMTGLYPHTQSLLVEMESHELFYPRWPRTRILQISISLVVGITDVVQLTFDKGVKAAEWKNTRLFNLCHWSHWTATAWHNGTLCESYTLHKGNSKWIMNCVKYKIVKNFKNYQRKSLESGAEQRVLRLDTRSTIHKSRD
jgi:hypothetical protein